MMQHTTLDVRVLKAANSGGRIRISTGDLDRQNDRVLPYGARLDNYKRNPVVLFGHRYTEPWAVIGRANSVQVTPTGLDADFTLREATSDHDPQTIVRALWDEGMLKAASIGFNPIEKRQNQEGGYDFTSWELLEFSLVPVPANAGALALAVKALGADPALTTDLGRITAAQAKYLPEARFWQWVELRVAEVGRQAARIQGEQSRGTGRHW